MKFYIVTPTYNALAWLKRCVFSVADQAGQGIEVHHHVQDGGSADGTADWLAEWHQQSADKPGYTFSYESCRDDGMYDAINRAWAKLPADADVTAHLNSDEQYLPDALRGVAAAMREHPLAEVVLGTYIIIDAESRYICHRRPIMPHKWSSRTVCEIITCSCFHRTDTFRRHGIRFNTRWRAVADLEFYRDLVDVAPRILVLPELLTSTFTVTGNNLAWAEDSLRELQQLCAEYPWYVSKLHYVTNRWCNLKRRLTDWRCAAPRGYSLYMPDDTSRSLREIRRPTCAWGCRTQGE